MLYRCEASWQGDLEYPKGESLQKELVRLRIENACEDQLLFLRHPAVVTYGHQDSIKYLTSSVKKLKEEGIEVIHSSRGGEITFHNLAQLIIYPILKLRSGEQDLHLFLRRMESSMIQTLASLGVETQRRQGYSGVWHEKGKISAIGVRANRWVTSHGMALNIGRDLSGFSWMIPCGISGEEVTSLAKLGILVSWEKVIESFLHFFAKEFEREIRWKGPRCSVDSQKI